MKKYYKVSFQWSDSVYCTNIAHAETEDAVKAHYAKYEWASVTEAKPWELDEAKAKGMPFIEV